MPKDNFNKMQQASLKKYSFERCSYSRLEYTNESFDSFTEENMEYLTANGENGGLVLLTGTGFQFLFSDDNWKDKNCRWASDGLHLISNAYHNDVSTFLDGLSVTHYHQFLGLNDGIVHTSIGFGKEKSGYKTSIFTSQSNKSLMCMTLTNTEDKEIIWNILLPNDDYDIAEDEDFIYGIRSSDEFFTKTAWFLWADKKIKNRAVKLKPRETVSFRFTFTSNFGEGEEYIDKARKSLELGKAFDEIVLEHKTVWEKYWNDAPYVQTPDEDINKLFYRSLFWELCQNGSKNYLSPEASFAGLSYDYSQLWSGHPFSYGASGQAVETFLMVGRSDLARNILEIMFQPSALITNAKKYTDIEGAYSFAHENDIDGYEISPGKWGTQRHIDGFVADLYRKYYEYNPNDKDFFLNRVYPVFRGVAQFYRGTLKYNDDVKSYLFPEWVFLSEFGARQNTLDVVLNAMFVFRQAAEYAKLIGTDETEAQEWLRLSDKLYIPQNKEIYLQYLGDTEKTDEGGGYYGKRAQLYLSNSYLVKNGYIDIKKAKRTMLSAWQDNRHGEGMITFVAGWGAKASAAFDMGDLCLEMLHHFLKCNPAFICETAKGRPYFQCSFVKALLSMLVGEDGESIRAFCAIPDEWKNVCFKNITTINGVKVSGSLIDGEIKEVVFSSPTV